MANGESLLLWFRALQVVGAQHHGHQVGGAGESGESALCRRGHPRVTLPWRPPAPLPRRRWTYMSCRQWAAVSTKLGWIRVPPQKWLPRVRLSCSDATKGREWGWASWPPTISAALAVPAGETGIRAKAQQGAAGGQLPCDLQHALPLSEPWSARLHIGL